MQLPVVESAGQRVMLRLFAVSVLSVQAQLYIASFFPLTLQQIAYSPRSYYMEKTRKDGVKTKNLSGKQQPFLF